MTLWGDFFDTPDFDVLDTKKIREFIELKNQINELDKAIKSQK